MQEPDYRRDAIKDKITGRIHKNLKSKSEDTTCASLSVSLSQPSYLFPFALASSLTSLGKIDGQRSDTTAEA
jgi:hypothetical protein